MSIGISSKTIQLILCTHIQIHNKVHCSNIVQHIKFFFFYSVNNTLHRGTAEAASQKEGHTWYFYLKQRKEFQNKNRYPTEGISKYNEEKPFSEDHLFFNVIPNFSSCNSCLMNTVEHTPIGKHYDDKGCQVYTCLRSYSEL